MKLTTRGFTLIELLVVVLIIAILAAVALPQYNKAVKKAQGREVLVALDALDKALTEYQLEHGRFQGYGPDCLWPEDLNIHIPDLKHFVYYNTATNTKTSYYKSLASRTAHQPGDCDCGIQFQSLKGSASIDVTWSAQTGLKTDRIHCSGTDCSSYFNCNFEEEPVRPCPVCDVIGTTKVCYLD